MKHSAPVLERHVAPREWRLSEEGRRRSAVLADLLEQCGPRVVVSSEEPKAAETAGIAADRLGVRFCTRPGLHEHDRTGAPFLSDGDFDRTAEAFFARPDELVWGDETAEQAGGRFEGAVRAVLREPGEGPVAVVAHGTVMSLLVARHNGVYAYEFWKGLGLSSLCVLSPDLRLEEVVGRVV